MAIALDSLPAGTPLADDIRLVFFDIDGTLLDREGQLQPATRKAIATLHQRGVMTAFASGRPPFAADALQAELQLTGPSVFYTGGHCVWQGSTFADHTLAPDEWHALARQARAQSIYLEGYFDDHYVTCSASDITAEHARHLRVQPRLLPFGQWPRQPAKKLLLGVNLEREPEGLAALEADFPAFHFAYAHLPSRPQWQFASVVSRFVDKTDLFHRLVNHLGLVPGQVAAFGDGGSDQAFLQAAGHGVAMGNASAQVKACARWVTRPSWEDGVAYGLDRLLGNR
ncbi:HAD family hydrolase [Simiduia agarivorans]|uniref:HAD-superfamily hydrolase n=1 Tax=Simiduia agarivorans (strain DSM 21679 / JCM 13881 / BCRC 17597 / SA1) TaxID=1117647 RepID=K4KEG2_SIMAS|nr:HAD-IIB family hydrolase [Simiduia agarivorans]AFU97306.1 HAD-superfamily hydrolase [Simiduia agarivorans SA1 = DSM 21679]